MDSATLPALWATCVDHLKDRVANRTFWVALEKSRVIALDGDVLVIGLDISEYNLASHLQQSSHANAIAEVVNATFGRQLTVRVIEGTTIDDWEEALSRDEAAAKLRTGAPKPAKQPVAAVKSNDWDQLYDDLAQLYQDTPNRLLALGKARYANDALYMLAEAMDSLYTDEGDEALDRSVGRALDRISHSTEIPAPVLAFELQRLRAWRAAEEEPAA